MAAHQHINPGQLRMLIPATEVKGYHPAPGDLSHHATNESFWQSRLERGEESGLAETVGFEGVHEPVNVYHRGEIGSTPMIANGHHRIAAAATYNPNSMIPVSHYGAPDSFHKAVWDKQTGSGTGEAYTPAMDKWMR